MQTTHKPSTSSYALSCSPASPTTSCNPESPSSSCDPMSPSSSSCSVSMTTSRQPASSAASSRKAASNWRRRRLHGNRSSTLAIAELYPEQAACGRDPQRGRSNLLERDSTCNACALTVCRTIDWGWPANYCSRFCVCVCTAGKACDKLTC